MIRRALLILLVGFSVICAIISRGNGPQYGNELVALPKSLSLERKMILVEATAYAKPLFPEGQLTRCETPVGWGTIAVDPDYIPLWSRVRLLTIDKKGRLTHLFNGQEFRALDTGRLIKKYIVDIWMHSEDEALQWGRRSVVLEIVN